MEPKEIIVTLDKFSKPVIISKIVIKDKEYIDVRKYYYAGDELLPTKKGITLNRADWGVVVSHLKGVIE